ncbi:MAG TPA: GNAT family N-acetyltransferase [Candidatus Dormibacteraeota bacterium]|nr:GNAT family N-acetyltransferase [Candidatus Dormibacteraeota bacterium]
MSVRIRPGELADVPVIAELIRGLARFEKLEHEVVMTEEKLTDSLFGERRYAETLIAEDGDQPVGFALFFHNYSTFLAQPGIYLEDLFVVPEHRGGGIGRALLERLAQIAVERGCGRLEWAVLDWNVDAIRFYERLGARPNADWTVYRLTGESLRKVAAPGARRAHSKGE